MSLPSDLHRWYPSQGLCVSSPESNVRVDPLHPSSVLRAVLAPAEPARPLFAPDQSPASQPDANLSTLTRRASFGVVLVAAPQGQPHASPGQRPGEEAELNEARALKGRHNRRTRRCLNPSSRASSIWYMQNVSPLQGSDVMVGTGVPRALPWADLLRPLGGQVQIIAIPKRASEGALRTCPEIAASRKNTTLACASD